MADNDRGITEIISIMLMVAIAVILAAIIGSFVIQTVNQASESSPSVAFSASQINNTHVEITHNSGERIDSNNTRLLVEGSEIINPFNGQITAGDTAIIEANRTDSITMIYEGGEKDYIIFQRE